MSTSCLIALVVLAPGGVLIQVRTRRLHPSVPHTIHQVAGAPRAKPIIQPEVKRKDEVESTSGQNGGQLTTVGHIDYSPHSPSHLSQIEDGGEVNVKRHSLPLLTQDESADSNDHLADPAASLEDVTVPTEGTLHAAAQATGIPKSQAAVSMEKAFTHKEIAWDKYQEIEAMLQGKLTPQKIDGIWAAYLELKEAANASTQAAEQSMDAFVVGVNAAGEKAMAAASSAQSILKASTHQMRDVISMTEALEQQAVAMEKHQEIEAALQGKLTPEKIDEVLAAYAALKEAANAANAAAKQARNAWAGGDNAAAGQATLAASSAGRILKGAMNQMRAAADLEPVAV